MKGVSPSDRIVLRELMAAADSGAPCPSNLALAEAMGANSPTSAVSAVAKLERRELITVERTRHARKVTIVESGKATAWSGRARPQLDFARPSEELHSLKWDVILARRTAAAEARARYVAQLLDEEQRKYGLARRGRPLASMPA